MNNDIKIAFFDIDGTIVSFSSHCIPQSALTALKSLHRTGIEIVIATGRGAEPIPEIKEVPYSAIIGLNGAECTMRDGSSLYRHTIPADLFEKVLSLASVHNFAVAAKFREGFIVDRITHRVEAMAANIASPCPPVRNLRELFYNQGTGQVCIFTDPETEKTVMAQLSGLHSSRWCDIFADINLDGIDKGKGIRDYLSLRSLYDIKSISFGDGGNDIPMFHATDISVAMGNACDNVKKEADYITDHIDKDGLAKALQYFGLI